MLTRTSLTIRLHPDDDVVIARAQLVSGTQLLDEKVTVSGLVPPGHKVAARAIRKGEPVRRYNQIIGFASRDIAAGEHVHLNNLQMGAFDRDYAFGVDAKPTQYIEPPATFMGIARPDGRIATRNYIGILSTVNCSATVARGIADHFRREQLAALPERRRCGRAHARQRLRDGHAGRRNAGAAPHAWRLRAARQFRRRADDRSRMRGQPDQRVARRGKPARGAVAAYVQHPGHGRDGEDDRARDRDDRGNAAACERGDARGGARVASCRRPAMRRLRRLFGDYGESGAGRGGRSAGAARRHRDPVRDPGDLRRRAPAHAARGIARGGRKAHRSGYGGGKTTPSAKEAR